jgi:ABC-type multidrug transport system fused ATPase/permease subunit
VTGKEQAAASSPQPTPVSLREGARRLVGIMPVETQRALRRAAAYSFVLAGVEFVAIFVLYPVFGFLAQPSADSFSLPLVGIDVSRSSARVLAVVALGALVVRSVLTFVYRRWWLRVTAIAELRLSSRLLRTYTYAPYLLHLQTLSSSFMAQTVSGVNIACQSGLVGLVGAVSAGLLVVGLSLSLVAIQPAVGLVVFGCGAVAAALYLRVMRGRIVRDTSEVQHQVRTTYRAVSVLLGGIREITVFNQRETYLARADESRHAMVVAKSRVALFQDIPRLVLEVGLYLVVLVVLFVLLSMESAEQVLPLVALYIVAGLRIIPTLIQLLGNLSSLRSGSHVAGELADEVEHVESIRPQVPAVSVHPYPSCAELTLEHVGYRYTADGPRVLDDVALQVPFGTFVGIVGESGSGKTTLVNVVLGLLDADRGTVSYGGRQIHSNDPAWYERVAVVPQNVFLTDESIADNIRAGAAPDDERLAAAVELAGLSSLVDQLDDGVDTLLLEGGARLSEGQRQRVGLARALFRQPEVLVLDEPTSALDAETEQHVVNSINQLRNRMTILAVAHRTHTLSGADIVVEMDGGRIVRSGSPDELLGRLGG